MKFLENLNLRKNKMVEHPRSYENRNPPAKRAIGSQMVINSPEIRSNSPTKRARVEKMDQPNEVNDDPHMYEFQSILRMMNNRSILGLQPIRSRRLALTMLRPMDIIKEEESEEIKEECKDNFDHKKQQ